MYNPQPQYAQLDASKNGKIHDDALPAMPSWETAPSKKVFDDHNEDVELGTLDHVHEQTAPMLANQAPTPRVGYGEHLGAERLPYQQYGAHHGGDLGSPYEQHSFEDHPNPYGGTPAPAQSYGNTAYRSQGNNNLRPQPTYSTYAASETSTRYEPASTYAGQELGTAYRSKPPLVAQQLSASSGGPIRKPVQSMWREV